MKAALHAARWACGIALSSGCVAAVANEPDADPLHASTSWSQGADSVVTAHRPGATLPCSFTATVASIGLVETLERALCRDPQARQAWASVKFQEAQVGVARAAYLPGLNLSAGLAREDGNTIASSLPGGRYRNNTTSRTAALDLRWTLFDFGARDAALANARQLLRAVDAAQDATIQSVFAATARLYYEVLSAQGALHAREQAEDAARENFLAADGRYRAGAGALSDKLQAETNHAQTILDRVRAEGQWKNVRGELALAVGMPADTDLTLEEDTGAAPTPQLAGSVRALMREAAQRHPSLVAARARLGAAQANVAAARAEGKPTVVLAASLDRNEQRGQYLNGTYVPDKSIGVQLRIPLYDGAAHAYQVSAARAQEDIKAAALSQAEQQVALDVWRSYQEMDTETADVQATAAFLRTAHLSYQVALGRYKAGVGTIIELLGAQSAEASASQQRVQALSKWRIARLQLALSLGNLGFWSID